MTEISGDDGRSGRRGSRPGPRTTPTFLDVGAPSVLKALELERLSTELRSSLRELRESRARIMSERGQGASADRARPSRRRPAVLGRAADPAGAGRRAVAGEPGPRRATAGRARRGGRRGARAGPVAGARGLPVAAGRSRAGRGAALCRAAQSGSDTVDADGVGRHPARWSRRRSTSAASRRCRTR